MACTSPSLTFPMMVCRCLAHNASWPTGRRVRLASTPTAAGLAYPGPDGVNFISQVIVARKAVVAFHFVDFMETIITVGKNNAVIYVSVVKTSLRTLKCTSALWVISPVMTVIRHPLFFYPLYQKHLLCTRISLLASVDHCLSLSLSIYIYIYIYISASWYRPVHHLGLCALPMLRCSSFFAYTPNWPVALFLLLLHPPRTLYTC